MATFKSIDPAFAEKLVDFVDRRRIGKSIEIEGKTYTLDYISHNTSAFFQSRGLSVYYRVDRSVIRISDHWSSSRGFPKSGKLNCGLISDQFWSIENPPGGGMVLCWTYAGKFPFRMLAGICGLSVLNRECEHWRRA